MGCLGELERLSKLGLIDLYYGDESRVSVDPCVPYGWQFAGESVFMPAAKGAGLNCFALLTRANDLLFDVTHQRITSQFIVEQSERLSFSVRKMTVVVLDNARVHTSQRVQERRPFCDLRHTFGTRLAEAGCSEATISELMGHTDPQTTRRYTHGTDRAKREAVEAARPRVGAKKGRAQKVVALQN